MPAAELLPSLLERLTDDAPGTLEESGRARTLSTAQLRELVMRDLSWLLNATRLETVQPLHTYSYVQRSVLNYGLPGLAGMSAGSMDLRSVERELRNAILAFEPRLLPHTVQVRALTEASKGNAIAFRIEGQLRAEPVPIALLLQSEIDLETGQVNVTHA